MEIIGALDIIHNSIEPFLTENGFTTVVPEGVKKGELPVSVSEDDYELNYKSDKNAVLVRWNSKSKKMTLNCAVIEDGEPSGFGEVSLWLFDDASNDERDAKSIANDFEDSLRERFGAKAKIKVERLQTVSKNAVKNGTSVYDEKTLATKLAVIFPELKEDVRANVERYGDFLPEEFFRDHASKSVMQALKLRDKQVLKKLFNCLNEMYSDGNNALQGIIAVTLLGNIGEDERVMATAEEYMDEYLSKSVKSVNKILLGRGGARAKKKLENPPVYREKRSLFRR